jgi:hypothetical protein
MMVISLLAIAATCLVIDPYDWALDPCCLPNFLNLERLFEGNQHRVVLKCMVIFAIAQLLRNQVER